MLVLYYGNTQMKVFHSDNSPDAIPWLKNMPRGYALEYTPNSCTPGKLVAYSGPNGSVVTQLGHNLFKDI